MLLQLYIRYQKIDIYFLISEIVIFDIQNNYFEYLKYVRVFGYQKIVFFVDIWNNYLSHIRKK